jgi:hypothetical protein
MIYDLYIYIVVLLLYVREDGTMIYIHIVVQVLYVREDGTMIYLCTAVQMLYFREDGTMIYINIVFFWYGCCMSGRTRL